MEPEGSLRYSHTHTYSGFRLNGTHGDLGTLPQLRGRPKYKKLHVKVSASACWVIKLLTLDELQQLVQITEKYLL
jgi:hypothetical protein